MFLKKFGTKAMLFYLYFLKYINDSIWKYNIISKGIENDPDLLTDATKSV